MITALVSLAICGFYAYMWLFFYVRKDGVGRLFLLANFACLFLFFFMRGLLFLCFGWDGVDTRDGSFIIAHMSLFVFILLYPALYVSSYLVKGKHKEHYKLKKEVEND